MSLDEVIETCHDFNHTSHYVAFFHDTREQTSPDISPLLEEEKKTFKEP